MERVGVEDSVAVAGLNARVEDHGQIAGLGARDQLEHEEVLEGDRFVQRDRVGLVREQLVEDSLRVGSQRPLELDASRVGMCRLDAHDRWVGFPRLYSLGHAFE